VRRAGPQVVACDKVDVEAGEKHACMLTRNALAVTCIQQTFDQLRIVRQRIQPLSAFPTLTAADKTTH